MSKKVTLKNFPRAESDRYFNTFSRKAGGVDRFYHFKDFDANNIVVRMNCDTLYSFAVIDTSKQVIVHKPDTGYRYCNMMVVDQDHYIVMCNDGEGNFVFEPKNTTRYLLVAFRILLKTRSKKEFKEVHAIQNELKITTTKSSDKFPVLPTWDMPSYELTKHKIGKFLTSTFNSKGGAGKRGCVDTKKHLVATLTGWGALPERYAYYEIKIPAHNDGSVQYKLSVKDVPVEAFWSITIYDSDGMIQPNKGPFSLNCFTAKPDNGVYTINFTNDTSKKNRLAIYPGWNYTVRMYRPDKSILSGDWMFPEAVETK
ncbi:DUF1254/DUF1214 domain-containing protein [Tetraselmis virus 1]|uniref:DUF1254/DUF1214 domain-containing protein n=1 Tax=Tetraselmis virus 1 TaxID=2060617 RepID=A0A2P0VP21_9VIRU|nr:DUF1254/DUF1214 domain-containing protein [Tetraselmis virus 1]AUF82666.1 DUF1254/DUF1214 domain-containing protein [Tetraselmis virus 1]